VLIVFNLGSYNLPIAKYVFALFVFV